MVVKSKTKVKPQKSAKTPPPPAKKTRVVVPVVMFYKLCEWAKTVPVQVGNTTLQTLAYDSTQALGIPVTVFAIKNAFKAIGRDLPQRARVHSVSADNAALAASVVKLYNLCGYAGDIPLELLHLAPKEE